MARWCRFAAIDPAYLASVIAEVRALPGVAANATFCCEWRLTNEATSGDFWRGFNHIRPPSQRIALVLSLHSSALQYPEVTGYVTREVVGSVTTAMPGVSCVAKALAVYATSLDTAANESAATRLRDPQRKARRDAEVADARKAAEGVRAIVARMTPVEAPQEG